MPKITKAIIPAAGLGTRVYPATLAMPKAMFPIINKPSIQYIAEEAVASGITDILIIINSADTLTEQHFAKLGLEANFRYVIQHEQKGLGHAVLLGEQFADGNPVAVMYCDDMVESDIPCIGQLCDVYEKFGKAVVGMKQVPADKIHKFGSLKVEHVADNVYKIPDMIEKPAKGMEYSLFAILGRCILTPDVFGLLKQTPAGAGGEIQLTDAMKKLAHDGMMMGIDYIGKHHDIGNKLAILQACVELGLKHDEIGADFRDYLKNLEVKNNGN